MRSAAAAQSWKCRAPRVGGPTAASCPVFRCLPKERRRVRPALGRLGRGVRRPEVTTVAGPAAAQENGAEWHGRSVSRTTNQPRPPPLTGKLAAIAARVSFFVMHRPLLGGGGGFSAPIIW